MAEAESKELAPEDRQRMRRLSEEIEGRLQEMALILTRTQGVTLSKDAVLGFVPQPPDAEFGAEGPAFNTGIVFDQSLGYDCLCRIDPPGVSKMCQLEPIMSTV